MVRVSTRRTLLQRCAAPLPALCGGEGRGARGARYSAEAAETTLAIVFALGADSGSLYPTPLSSSG